MTGVADRAANVPGLTKFARRGRADASLNAVTRRVDRMGAAAPVGSVRRTSPATRGQASASVPSIF